MKYLYLLGNRYILPFPYFLGIVQILNIVFQKVAKPIRCSHLSVNPPLKETDKMVSSWQLTAGQRHLAPPLRPGRSIELPGFRFTTIEIRDGRIRRLRGEPLPGAEGEDSEKG